MKSNYLDKYIKRKLEERKVEPSADAWNRLSEMLENDHEEVEPRKMLMYWVAALVILAVISSVYLFRTDSDLESIKVVDTTEEVPVRINNDILIEDDMKKGEQIVNKEKKLLEKTINEATKRERSSSGELSVSSHKMVAQELQTKTQEEKKVEEVVSRVLALRGSKEVTEAEVESLLIQAQKDLYRNRIIKNIDSLSAMALLLEVETELDQSFKEKVLEALKESFVKVKTAVAERNQ